MMHEDCGMTQNYVGEDVGEAVDFVSYYLIPGQVRLKGSGQDEVKTNVRKCALPGRGSW